MPDGCQGNPRTPTIIEKVCPQCGAMIEMYKHMMEIAAAQKARK